MGVRVFACRWGWLVDGLMRVGLGWGDLDVSSLNLKTICACTAEGSPGKEIVEQLDS